MTRYAVIFLLFVSSVFAQPRTVKPGIEVLRDNGFNELLGKRVGLVTNPTGVDSKLKSTVDILYEAEEVNLAALYGPEHGVRGSHSAGEYVEFYTDPQTNLPVYSLYGKTRKPSPEMLKGIDALVYDIQDIGSRSYTYISTMGLVMEACAENDIEFIVLDRPNPLGGNRIEGNYVEEGYFSFVSQFAIPYVHGLTTGELAILLNEEGLLKNGVKCKLSVVLMEGWRRNMSFEETGLEWVPSSPHIPEKDSPFFYAVSGIVGELGTVSIGVGYTIPFKAFAAEWINPHKLADAMNALNLPCVIFRPISYKPYYATGKGTELHGVQVHITDYMAAPLTLIQFYFLQEHHKLYPDKDLFEMAAGARIGMFDKVAGSDKVRKIITENYSVDELKIFFDKDVEKFRKIAGKYYLYN